MKNNTRKVSFRYDLLDKNDVKIGTLDGIKGKVSYGEFRTIKRSATFTLDEYLQREINYLSDQIQPWFVLHMPEGGTVEWSLGIFLIESPSRTITGNQSRREIGAYDKTIIIEEDRFTEPYFIAAGAGYISAITGILTSAGITKVNIAESALTLQADKEFFVGTKKKDAITELLNEINYTSIVVDEIGYMKSESYVEPSKRTITQIYSTGRDSIILPQFKEDSGLAGRPNTFIVIAKNIDTDTELRSVFINDSPHSPISTVNRGRQVVAETYEIDNIADQKTLDDYARRIAIENSSGYSHLTFGTALMPTHGSADTLYLDIPNVFDTPQKFYETAWEMDLKYDGVMQHEARRVIQL